MEGISSDKIVGLLIFFKIGIFNFKLLSSIFIIIIIVNLLIISGGSLL